MNYLFSFFESKEWAGVPPVFNLHIITTPRRFGLGIVFTKVIGGWFNSWNNKTNEQKEYTSQPYHLILNLMWLQVDLMINITRPGKRLCPID